MNEECRTESTRPILGLSRNVFFLGVVSFLTDVSSEMIFATLPLFLSNILGVKTGVIGLIEGVAESTSTVLRVVSGWLSDRIGKRKPLTIAGYGLSTLAKPFMLLASSWGMVLAVRFSDRVGKGIRTAPRDALIADSCADNTRGKSFGFHRTMDTAGAMLGILCAAAVVFLTQRNSLELTLPAYRWLVIFGAIPAFISVAVVIILVRESKPAAAATAAPVSSGKPFPDLSRQKPAAPKFNTNFKVFLVILALFTLGASSDAFLILRAQNVGTSTLNILLMLGLFNLVYALLATPAGILSDRLGRKGIIIVGWVVFALTRLGFAFASSPIQILLLFAFYGVFYALTEGVAKAMVADMVPIERRGTAYGLYYGVVGACALPASLVAGWLWQAFNPAAPFLFGAGLSFIAAVALLVAVRQQAVPL